MFSPHMKLFCCFNDACQYCYNGDGNPFIYSVTFSITCMCLEQPHMDDWKGNYINFKPKCAMVC